MNTLYWEEPCVRSPAPQTPGVALHTYSLSSVERSGNSTWLAEHLPSMPEALSWWCTIPALRHWGGEDRGTRSSRPSSTIAQVQSQSGLHFSPKRKCFYEAQNRKDSATSVNTAEVRHSKHKHTQWHHLPTELCRRGKQGGKGEKNPAPQTVTFNFQVQ